MNYKVSSTSFEHPLIKPLLEQLTQYFESIHTKFFVIGAVARDIILSAHDEKSGRVTSDLDIAIAITEWSKFERIEKELVQIEGFTKDSNKKQRFKYLEIFDLDIVPFGSIMKEGDKIFWPPDESVAMSVLGFSEVNETTHKVVIDDHLSINVASLAGVFLLKLVAWNERNLLGNKDADDLGFILTNYLNVNEERAFNENNDIYDDEDFSITTAGAKLLGRDIALILKNSPENKSKFIDIIQSEIIKQGESRLVNQIVETNRIINYKEAIKSLNFVMLELSKD